MGCYFDSHILQSSFEGRALNLSTYEKELLALVLTIKKLRPYVLGQVFIVKTDQQSLKFLLEQKVGTPAQQKWISKLICYDFHIEYKQGKENKVAYTLSRRFEVEAKEIGCMMISGPSLDWVERLKLSYSIDMHFKHIIEQLNDSLEVVLGVFSLFSMVNGALLRNGRIYLG